MSSLTRHLLLYFMLAWGLLHAACVSAAEALPEYSMKAGYLYNFALLTEWPAEAAGDKLEVCILGPDHFGSALETLRGKQVNNRTIAIRFLDQLVEARKCHIVYITEAEPAEVAVLKTEIANRPVLTVTDDERLVKAGNITIILKPERQRLVFEINNQAAKHANLNISARLLRLARGGNE